MSIRREYSKSVSINIYGNIRIQSFRQQKNHVNLFVNDVIRTTRRGAARPGTWRKSFLQRCISTVRRAVLLKRSQWGVNILLYNPRTLCSLFELFSEVKISCNVDDVFASCW